MVDLGAGAKATSDISLGVGKFSAKIGEFISNISLLEWILIIIFIVIAVVTYQIHKKIEAQKVAYERYRR